jgi:hypothetical protein
VQISYPPLGAQHSRRNKISQTSYVIQAENRQSAISHIMIRRNGHNPRIVCHQRPLIELGRPPRFDLWDRCPLVTFNDDQIAWSQPGDDLDQRTMATSPAPARRWRALSVGPSSMLKA